MNINSLHRIANHQHGVVSLVQASTLGIGRSDWRALCRDGVVIEVFPDVARLAGAPATAIATIKAATLAVGEGAMASHGSSAFAWGAPCRGIDPVHIALASRHRFTRVDGIALHRPRDIKDLEPILRQQIPTTRPLRTLCDIGAVDPGAVSPVLQHFVAAGLFKPEAVWNSLQRHRGRGRAGAVALEEALLGLALGSKAPDSLLEEVMAGVFTRHHLPPFEFHARVAGLEVDFLVVNTRVIVETDGWESHGLDRDQFEWDREKDALLGEAGYIVRRFTWRQVRRRPAWVAARIRGTLATWAPHVLAS